MDEPAFRLLVDETLTALADQVDELDPDEIDSTLSYGVLKCLFESSGKTILLSQQVPLREIWLSANRSAWHFDQTDGTWLERDTREPMLPILSKLFTEHLGEPVSFEG